MADLWFVNVAHAPLCLKVHLALAEANSTMCNLSLAGPRWRTTLGPFVLTQDRLRFMRMRHNSERYCQVCANKAGRLVGLLTFRKK
jgi:hypothetical protein